VHTGFFGGGNLREERPRRRWEDNNKMDLQEVEWGGMGWIDVAQNRFEWRSIVEEVMIFWVA
jgi:hypothetical protein